MRPIACAPARSSSPSSPTARSTASAQEVDAALGGAIADALAIGEIAGKPRRDTCSSTQKVSPTAAFSPFRSRRPREVRAQLLARYAGTAVRYLGTRNVEEIAFALPGEAQGHEAACASFIAEGAITGAFETTIYQQKPERKIVTSDDRDPRRLVSTQPSSSAASRAARRSAKR